MVAFDSNRDLKYFREREREREENGEERKQATKAYKNGDINKVLSMTKDYMQPYAAIDTRKIEK